MSSDDAAKSPTSPSFSQSTTITQESPDPGSELGTGHPLSTHNNTHTSSPTLSNESSLPVIGRNDQEHKDIGTRESGTEVDKDVNEKSNSVEGERTEPTMDVAAGSVGPTGANEEGQEWAANGDHELKRVKVYELKGQRWEDQGTAFCFGHIQEETNQALLLARAESNHNEIILSTAIRSNDVYQRQQDTLIVWTEPDGADYALSFQDPDGCSEVWNFILEVQRHMNAGAEERVLGSSSPVISPESFPTTASIIRSGHLPQPQLGIITEIEKAIKTLARTQAVKERICEYIQQEDYIKSMIEVMNQAEDLENLESLHSLCTCMQTILLMNDHSMYEHILEDDIFFGVVGMLEYDPEFPTYKANYREFLHQTSHFHQPIPIRDELIQRKIHHTYRLQFMKDVVLARVLDDSTFNVLNSCIIFNQIDIITHIQQDPNFLREVVGLYADEDTLSGGGVRKPEAEKVKGDGMDLDGSASIDAKINGVTANDQPSNSASYASAPPEDLPEHDLKFRREVILLIQQLCVMGKNVQLPARMALFRALVDRGILFAVQWALSLPEREDASRLIISAAGEILSALLDHDLNGVRGHILKHVVAIEKDKGIGKKSADKAETILALMCRMMANSQELAVQSQVGDALKVLMEIPPNDGSEQHPAAGVKLIARNRDDPGTEKFLEYFYKNCIETLFKPFGDLPEFKTLAEPVLILTREKTNLYLYLCDLLTNFALQHLFRSHFYMLSSNIARRVASLLSCRDKHLRLAAFRFFRAALKLNNRNLLNHLMKLDIFKPIIALTLQESRRDNLLSSSCLEFFEHMRRENYKDLIHHCMTKYESQIRRLAETPLAGPRFMSFIRRWEINNEPAPTEAQKPDKPAIPTQPAPHAQRMEAEALENDYFSVDDDEDSLPSPFVESPPFHGSFPAQQQKFEKLLRRKRQNANLALSKPFRSSNILPRTPPLGSLVDYDDDDDDDHNDDASARPSQIITIPNQAAQKSSPLDMPASPRLAHRQIQILSTPPQWSSEDDDENNVLEALLRGKPVASPSSATASPPSSAAPSFKLSPGLSSAPLRPSEKRRRDEDEDEFERLAHKAKRPDLGAQKAVPPPSSSIVGRTGSTKAGDDPPKKIKLKFGLNNLGAPPPTSTSPAPSEAGAKDGDTG